MTKPADPAADRAPLSLSVKITVMVYWMLMFAGIAVMSVQLIDLEQRVRLDYERRADLFAHYLHDYIDLERPSSVQALSKKADGLRHELEIPGVSIRLGQRTTELGRETSDETVLTREMSLPPHLFTAIDRATLSFRFPNLRQRTIDQRKQLVVQMGGGFFVFGLVLTFLLRRTLTQPFLGMVKVARAFSSGQTEARFETGRRDEFGYLGRFMNEALEKMLSQQAQLREALERLAQSQAALEREKERIQVTLHSIGDGVIATDAQGRIEYMNPAAEHLTGWNNQQVRGKVLAETLRLVNEATREPIPNPVVECMASGRVCELADYSLLVRDDGGELAIADSAAPIRGADGTVVGGVMVFRDVQKERALAQQLSYQAMHDDLTGLCNRRAFEAQLSQALASAQGSGHHHALCYLDLDQFKIVNDSCGHAAGDELLRQLAERLRSRVRASDVVARLGGDEFGVLLRQCPIERAHGIAEGLRQSVEEFRFLWGERSFDVGVSVGLVEIIGEEGLADVFTAADVACYAAKDAGRNRVHLYRRDDEALKRRWSQMNWVQRIKRALAENRFELFAQPITAIADEKAPSCYEILLRMIDESGGVVLPAAFMPTAERYDLMPAIDRWVVRTAFQWMSKRRPDSNYRIAINLSAASLCDEGFLPFVRSSFLEAAIEPQRICFEITESAAIANFQQAAQFIASLRVLGCQFALDDFGKGFSSFGYLKNLNVDYLKIDGGFVRDINDDRISYVMVESINHIGHEMGLRTVAEFVEDQHIMSCLKRLGVDYAQGYAIARPGPLDEVVLTRDSKRSAS